MGMSHDPKKVSRKVSGVTRFQPTFWKITRHFFSRKQFVVETWDLHH